jgi:hypothetical protein
MRYDAFGCSFGIVLVHNTLYNSITRKEVWEERKFASILVVTALAIKTQRSCDSRLQSKARRVHVAKVTFNSGNSIDAITCGAATLVRGPNRPTHTQEVLN